MRICFMGTPEFAVPTLQELIAVGHEIVAVYTQPDKPRGRGMTPSFSPVKKVAVAEGIPVRQPTTLRNNEEELEYFSSLHLDVAVVVAYGKLLPTSFLETPRLGCINGHGSLLPKWRGAAPIQWSILAGDNETGITTMKMSEGMDEGDILLKQTLPIGEDETYPSLSESLSQVCATLMSVTLTDWGAGRIKAVPQDITSEKPTFAPMIEKNMGDLNFNNTAQAIHNQIRALQPWPGARFQHNGKWVKVFEVAVHSGESAMPPGTVLDTGTFEVACGEGSIELKEVQMEGKKRVSGEDFCRGYRLKVGDMLTSD